MTEKVLPFATRCDGCALVRTEEDAQEKPPEACVTFAAEIEPSEATFPSKLQARFPASAAHPSRLGSYFNLEPPFRVEK